MHPTQAALRDALLAARRQHRALDPAPHWSLAVPDADTAQALQQAQGVALGEWAPDGLPGYWKSGSAACDVPLVHAPLLPSGVHAPGADLRAQTWLLQPPLVEAEIALRLGQPVDAATAQRLHPDEAPALVDALAVAIEVVDSRWRDLAHTPPLLKLADFQVHGALVLGPWQPWRAIDWSAQAGWLRCGDAAPIAFRGSHPLGTPTWLLPGWLRYLTRHGATVPAGTVVTTGAWCGGVPVSRGQHVLAHFDGLGEVEMWL
ncbi:fumarylacetoacetate hydrolase family protein [Ideonella sp. 4Y16]|uniref:fumarylacetoacetate hydrolase family protein n=1 Tax=Ideonella alba TaxID=2824118 RepID=UPI001B35E211|nr:fumarylacetoacetate hydrolase family protein [Ideonella alba]MBQ0944732.1 fumarylacetoacetate hydrolase family protein [Ideonella alba]